MEDREKNDDADPRCDDSALADPEDEKPEKESRDEDLSLEELRLRESALLVGCWFVGFAQRTFTLSSSSERSFARSSSSEARSSVGQRNESAIAGNGTWAGDALDCAKSAAII